MEMRERFGARAAVVATFLTAVLSVVTGIVNIGVPPPATGPIASLVPDVVRTTVGFTGTLTGFVLLTNAFGLRRGYRAAWYVTMVLLPVTALQGLAQTNERAIPLVALSLVAFAVVGLNFRRFDREVDLSATQLSAVLAIAGAQVYGTVGAFALSDHFNGIDTLVDAFYFSLVTGSTVGYGDITPQTQVGRLFGLSVLLVTVSSFAVALGVLLTPAIEARLTKALGRMTQTQLDLLENHILVLGYGDLTEPILEELARRKDFVIVTPDAEKARLLSDRGFNVLTADPSDVETLTRANVSEASAVVVATNNDAEDALAILTARQLNPEVTIVAAATHRENVDKLKRAGADTVISPTTIGGHLIVESALGGTGAEELAERLITSEPAAMNQSTDAAGETAAEAERPAADGDGTDHDAGHDAETPD